MTRPVALAVDDDPESLEALACALDGAGYEVVSAHDGVRARRRLGDRRVAVGLVACTQAGLEALRELRRHDPAVDILLLAAPDAVSRAVAAVTEAGAADYLVRPLNPDELRHRLAQLAEGRRLRAELAASRVSEARPAESPLPTLAEMERALILEALRRHPGNKDAVARALGISPRTMYRRLRAYSRPDGEGPPDGRPRPTT